MSTADSSAVDLPNRQLSPFRKVDQPIERTTRERLAIELQPDKPGERFSVPLAKKRLAVCDCVLDDIGGGVETSRRRCANVDEVACSDIPVAPCDIRADRNCGRGRGHV